MPSSNSGISKGPKPPPEAQPSTTRRQLRTAVKEVIDAIPPEAWDVSVWRRDDDQQYVNGRVDKADIARIVTTVMQHLMNERLSPCPRCLEMTLVAVHDSGNPLRIQPEPSPTGWLVVYPDKDSGVLRVSALDRTGEPGTRHHPHSCG